MRAAPAGEERGAPHYTVSASPQRPLEIVLPTLLELQGAEVSRECLSQFFLPVNVAELRASPTPITCVQRDTFWPAVHETPTVVAQVQGVLPEGKPIPHDQGHAAMPTCLGHVEETLVLVSGPGPGSSLPPRNTSDGCIPDRLGGRS